MTTTIRININADFLAQADVETPAVTSGRWAGADSITDFEFRIAATRTGAAIGSLSGTASFRSGDLNRYYKVFDSADLIAALTTYVGRVVYIILKRSGDVDDLWWPALVTRDAEGS